MSRENDTITAHDDYVIVARERIELHLEDCGGLAAAKLADQFAYELVSAEQRGRESAIRNSQSAIAPDLADIVQSLLLIRQAHADQLRWSADVLKPRCRESYAAIMQTLVALDNAGERLTEIHRRLTTPARDEGTQGRRDEGNTSTPPTEPA